MININIDEPGRLFEAFRRVARWVVFGVLGLMVAAVARLWLNPPSPGRDPFPPYGAEWEAFDADQRARIELDRVEDNTGDNPPDRKESP